MLRVVIILKTHYTEVKANVSLAIITIFAWSLEIQGQIPKHATFGLVVAEQRGKGAANPPCQSCCNPVPYKGQKKGLHVP